jgi:hypothetical protein
MVHVLLLGLSSTACRLFDSFLGQRAQKVMVDGELSAVASVGMGSAQGSVLSPILFACFIYDAFEQILNCKFHLYADDLQLLVNLGGDVDTLVRLVNEDLSITLCCSMCLRLRRCSPPGRTVVLL